MARIDEPTLLNKLRESRVPSNLHEGLIAYIMSGRQTGQFLRAVLENDLVEACKRADDNVKYQLYDVVFFLYNYTPIGCWGGPSNYAYWVVNGGFIGVYGQTNIVRDLEEGDRIIP